MALPIDFRERLKTETFRLELAEAVSRTSAERAVLACRAESGGWRYRPTDPLRPLFERPSWSVQEDANWRWHHQSLALVSLYTAYYLERRDTRALGFLEGLVDTWCSEADDPAFSWGEHTTPLRLERLLRSFGALFKDLPIRFKERLVELVDLHVERLSGDLACRLHNHALDQIYALLLAKRYLPFLDVSDEELAARLAVERAHLLSAEGIVTENAPGYQSWIPTRIAECHRLLTGEIDTVLLEQNREFTAWVARPDGTWPQIGDTLPGKRVDPLPGPRTGLRVFPHAGYAAYRDDRTWFLAKCGFLVNAHRHADDGGILLAVDGEDVFIEAGMFGYAKGWERDYARSPEAHNVSLRVGANVIRSTTSRRWQRHRNRWGMETCEDGIQCRSFMFDDAVYTRRIRFREGRIWLEDCFDTAGRIRTRFHVPSWQRVAIRDGHVDVGPVRLHHDLPLPRLQPGHHTVAYLRFEPSRVLEFEWPPGRLEARFVINLSVERSDQP